jgi:hypothetical protein
MKCSVVFLRPTRQRTVYNPKHAKNVSYEIVYLLPLPFDAIENDFGFVQLSSLNKALES